MHMDGFGELVDYGLFFFLSLWIIRELIKLIRKLIDRTNGRK